MNQILWSPEFGRILSSFGFGAGAVWPDLRQNSQDQVAKQFGIRGKDDLATWKSDVEYENYKSIMIFRK